MGFFQEVLDAVVDVCLYGTGLYRLGSWNLWIWLVSTILLKHQVVRPMLEKYGKKTAVERRRRKQRRLKDTLNDPVLVIGLEHKYMKFFKGDKQAALQAIDNLRDMAEKEIKEDDEPKGSEKRVAAEWLLLGTAIVGGFSFSFALAFSFFETSVIRTGDLFHGDVLFDEDLWDPFVQMIFFWLIQLLDSFHIWRPTQRKASKRSLADSEPLLGKTNSATAV